MATMVSCTLYWILVLEHFFHFLCITFKAQWFSIIHIDKSWWWVWKISQCFLVINLEYQKPLLVPSHHYMGCMFPFICLVPIWFTGWSQIWKLETVPVLFYVATYVRTNMVNIFCKHTYVASCHRNPIPPKPRVANTYKRGTPKCPWLVPFSSFCIFMYFWILGVQS